MDTNSNIPPHKKVVSVEILHLDDLGYGPQGKHTRREWRAECLENLLAGKAVFEAWQDSWQSQINTTLFKSSFRCNVTLDTEKVEILNSEYLPYEPYSLDFMGQSFANYVNANGVNFLHNALFTAAKFNGGYIDLGARPFIGDMDFSNSVFHANTSFSYVYFVTTARFDKAQFRGDADFTNTFVCGSTLFRDAKFCLSAIFRDAFFYGGLNFSNSEFKNKCRFEGATIEAKADFENAEITNVGHFERVRFKGEMPNFLGVDNAKTLLVFSGDEYFPEKDTSEDAIKRIGQLKRLADEHGQIDQALMFNKFELNAKSAQARIKAKSLTFLRKLENSDFWFANATYLYDQLSDYGRSFTHPLIAYLALLLITLWLAVVNTIIFSAKNCESEKWYLFTNLWREQIECVDKTKIGETKIPLSGWRAAFEYTSYRASGILDFADSDKQTIAVANRLFDQSIEPWWMRIWGVFKAIASTALLFLAALGLRNKYRIK